MRAFSQDHASIQSPGFTEDYYNSMRAAFTMSEWQQAASGLRDVAHYVMRPIKHMQVLKSTPQRPFDSALAAEIHTLQQKLTPAGKSDLNGIRGSFRANGLKSPYLD